MIIFGKIWGITSKMICCLDRNSNMLHSDLFYSSKVKSSQKIHKKEAKITLEKVEGACSNGPILISCSFEYTLFWQCRVDVCTYVGVYRTINNSASSRYWLQDPPTVKQILSQKPLQYREPTSILLRANLSKPNSSDFFWRPTTVNKFNWRSQFLAKTS